MYRYKECNDEGEATRTAFEEPITSKRSRKSDDKSFVELSAFEMFGTRTQTRTASVFDPLELEDEVYELDWGVDSDQKPRNPLVFKPATKELVGEEVEEISFRCYRSSSRLQDFSSSLMGISRTDSPETTARDECSNHLDYGIDQSIFNHAYFDSNLPASVVNHAYGPFTFRRPIRIDKENKVGGGKKLVRKSESHPSYNERRSYISGDCDNISHPEPVISFKKKTGEKSKKNVIRGVLGSRQVKKSEIRYVMTDIRNVGSKDDGDEENVLKPNGWREGEALLLDMYRKKHITISKKSK